MTQLNTTDEYYYYSHCGNVIAIPRECSASNAYRKAINKVARINKRFKMDSTSTTKYGGAL